jgi:hypothetical protein
MKQGPGLVCTQLMLLMALSLPGAPESSAHAWSMQNERYIPRMAQLRLRGAGDKFPQVFERMMQSMEKRMSEANEYDKECGETSENVITTHSYYHGA